MAVMNKQETEIGSDCETCMVPPCKDAAGNIIREETSACAASPSTASKVKMVKDNSIKNLIDGIAVTKLDCSFGLVKEEGNTTLNGAVMDQLRCKTSDVVIVFAVRRPSCSSCREHGMQLVELATKRDRKVSVMAIVKETGVADEELIKFYQNYFRMPVYKDEKWAVFHAMGGRRLGVIGMISGFLNSFKRHYDKKIPSAWNGGDPFLQGGLLIFDKKGQLRFSYEETFGVELDMEAILMAIKQTRAMYRAQKSGSIYRGEKSGSSDTTIDHSGSSDEDITESLRSL